MLRTVWVAVSGREQLHLQRSCRFVGTLNFATDMGASFVTR
jgi:hypothetical protein